MNLYFHLLLVTLAGFINKHQQFVIEYLQAENRVLREHLPPGRISWTDGQKRHLAEKAKAVGRSALKELGTIVTPETLLRWYRNLVAAKYDSSKNRKARPSQIKRSVKELIVEMAKSNPSWGYTRIRGSLYNLGHEVARNTVKRTLAENGIEPAPERGKHLRWDTFLKSHVGAIAGGDFFTVEVLSPFGLIRYFVFFVVDIGSRRVHVAGVTNQLSEAWMLQVARNLTDCCEGFLRNTRHLILDRDPNYSHSFRKLLRDSGVKVPRLPSRSPNLNAYAERFVRSVKSECLRKVIPLNERHLRNLITNYVEHDHLERNHQGIDNRLIRELPANTNSGEEVVRRRVRLGGVLNWYYRDSV